MFSFCGWCLSLFTLVFLIVLLVCYCSFDVVLVYYLDLLVWHCGYVIYLLFLFICLVCWFIRFGCLRFNLVIVVCCVFVSFDWFELLLLFWYCVIVCWLTFVRLLYCVLVTICLFVLLCLGGCWFALFVIVCLLIVLLFCDWYLVLVILVDYLCEFCGVDLNYASYNSVACRRWFVVFVLFVLVCDDVIVLHLFWFFIVLLIIPVGLICY